MEACVRGFSFMPETRVKLPDLKYVESNALEKAWKTTRRERLKQQEQKIWEEFVKEEDIVHNISQDDPYQFIDQLPEAYIKELLDVELQKTKQETDEIQVEVSDNADASTVEVDNQVVVLEEHVEDECNMLQIFDDDKDEDNSGPEEETLNDSVGSPCTVRERETRDEVPVLSPKYNSPDKVSSESSAENVTDRIESSIYCDKVKELRLKIREELLNIINILEKKDIMNIDPADVPKMMRRSVEFSARFGRVHLYQLQRQLVELERPRNAQAAGLVSLHQGLLTALQIYAKSLNQTRGVKESGDTLRALLRAARATRCRDIQATCDKVNATLEHHTQRMTVFLNSTENTSASCSRRSSKMKGMKKSVGTWSKSGPKSLTTTEARLSMYSKSSISKDNSSGTSKMHANSAIRTNVTRIENSTKSPKNPRRAVSGRGSARAPRTLVEAVPCTSNHSQEASPISTPKDITSRKINENTPRPNKNNIKSVHNTPRNKDVQPKTDKLTSPKVKDLRDCVESCRRNLNKKEKEDIISEKERDKSVEVKQEVTIRDKEGEKGCEKEKKNPESAPASCEVTKLLRQLCGGDAGNRSECVTGVKNAQLLCVTGSSPRQPSTPQLLRILEETIQKKTPKAFVPKPAMTAKVAEKYRMSFNIPERVTESLFQYRTKFVQHMLTSTMYANSVIGKPWEKIGSVTEQIIDELLLNCAKEMELHQYIQNFYKSETC